MSRKTIVFIFILLISLTAVFAEFGPPVSSEVKEFAPPQSTEMKEFGPPADVELSKTVNSQENVYWFHDILLKILIVSSLLVASLLIFLFLRTKKWARKLILISSVVITGLIFGGFLCPTSAVQNIILKAGTAYLILFSIPLISTLIFGRIYCSSVCPYGAISELLHIKKFSIKVPKKIDRILKYAKYGILVFLVLRVLLTGEIIDNTPFKAIFTFGGATLNWIMTGIFVFLSVFIYRPFCRYFCPYGALMAIISRFSIFRIRKDTSCVSCRICERECPMDAMDEQAVTDTDCILCGECCNKCPKGSLSLTTSKRSEKK